MIAPFSGQSHVMKFLLGLIIGAATSGYLVNNMTEEQRRKLESQIDKAGNKVKNSKVSDAVKDNAQQVASDASDAAVDKIDQAGDAASAKVADDTPKTSTGTTHT